MFLRGDCASVLAERSAERVKKTAESVIGRLGQHLAWTRDPIERAWWSQRRIRDQDRGGARLASGSGGREPKCALRNPAEVLDEPSALINFTAVHLLRCN